MEREPTPTSNPDQPLNPDLGPVSPQPDQAQEAELDEAAVREKIAKEEARIAGAEKTVEKLDHKDALYGHVGATMLGEVEITGPDGEPIERPRSRSMAERIKVRRMTNRDVKQARKASELSSRDKQLGKKTVSTGTLSKIDRVIQLGKLKKQFGAGEIDESEYFGRRFDIKAGKTSKRTRVTRHVQAGGVLYQSGREQLSANEPIASRTRDIKRTKAERVVQDGQSQIDDLNQQLIEAGFEPHLPQGGHDPQEVIPVLGPNHDLNIESAFTELTRGEELSRLYDVVTEACNAIIERHARSLSNWELMSPAIRQNITEIALNEIAHKAALRFDTTENGPKGPQWNALYKRVRSAYADEFARLNPTADQDYARISQEQSQSRNSASRGPQQSTQRQTARVRPTPRPPQRRQLSPEEQIAQRIAQESRDSGESLDVVEPRVRAEYEAEQRRAAQAVADNAARTAIES